MAGDKHETALKDAVQAPTVVEEPKAAAEIAKVDIPSVIMTGDEYDKAYRYLSTRYHVLTPVTAFSGMAPQHGLVVAKVLLDSDPDHGDVYQDRLFCKTGSKDHLDDEVAIAKVGLRKLALAGGWNLNADVMRAERNYWVIRGNNRFVGLDGAVQTFSATEEYDLREGSPQVRNMSPKQIEAARAHGLRGGEARALNAACREYGIRQKYTRRELQKAFVIMRMMFIPDAANELQMRIVTERALQGTTAMFPQSAPPVLSLEGIEGMRAPIDVTPGTIVDHPPAAAQVSTPGVPTLPPGYTLIQNVTVETKQKRDKSGTFQKWVCIDMHGEQTVSIKRDIGKDLMACWNQQDWKKGRPVEISAHRNSFNENEIEEINPIPSSSEEDPNIPFED